MHPQSSRELEEPGFLRPFSFALIELMMGLVCGLGLGRAVSCQLIAGEG